MVSIDIDTTGVIFYNSNMEGNTARIDGRHSRSEQHKEQVIRALLDLIRETGEVPRADILAERAGVSRRSVFRLFDDREALLLAVSEFMYEQLVRLFPFPDLDGLPPSERLDRLAGHLSSIYEYITPFRRVAERQKAESDLISRQRKKFREIYGAKIADAFTGIANWGTNPSQSHRELIQLVGSWSAWNFFRTSRGLSVDDARMAIRQGLSMLLGHASGERSD